MYPHHPCLPSRGLILNPGSRNLNSSQCLGLSTSIVGESDLNPLSWFSAELMLCFSGLSYLHSLVDYVKTSWTGVQLVFLFSPRDCGPSETQIGGHVTTNLPCTYREGQGGRPALLQGPRVHTLCRTPRQNVASYMTSTGVSCPCCPFWTLPSKQSSTEHSTAGCRNIS